MENITVDSIFNDIFYNNAFATTLKSINNLVHSFLEQLGYDTITCNANYEEMSADQYAEAVYFDLSFYDPTLRVVRRKKLQQWYNEHNYQFDIHLATFALLHEIGHLVATYDMAREDLDLMLINYFLSMEGVEDLDVYKQLEMEQDADREALAIYNQHTALVKELDRAIRKELGL